MQAHPDPSLPEIVRESDQFGVRFLMDDLEQEMADYEKLRTGQISTLWLRSLPRDLPSVLSRARVARGWTHRDLANALGTSEQQVQKDERGGYRKASLARLERVAAILGVRISVRAWLPVSDRGDLPQAPPGARGRRVVSVKRPADPSMPRLAEPETTAQPVMSGR
jgi:transcriptional regulator with XRE-family HTH domain